MGQQLPVAEGLRRGPGDGLLGQGPDLVEEAAGHLTLVAGRDALVEPVAVPAQTHLHERRGRVLRQAGAVGRERSPAAQRDLQRSDDPAPVGRLHATGRRRVEGSQAPVQGRRVGFGLQTGPDLRVAPRDPETVDHGPHVQPRAADQHRHRVPVADVVDHGRGPRLELGHRELLGRVHHVDQVVAHLGLIRGGGGGRADVHAPVDLHGVEGDDLGPADEPGHAHGEVRLARGGWADDHQRPLCESLPIGERPACCVVFRHRGRGAGAGVPRSLVFPPRFRARGAGGIDEIGATLVSALWHGLFRGHRLSQLVMTATGMRCRPGAAAAPVAAGGASRSTSAPCRKLAAAAVTSTRA